MPQFELNRARRGTHPYYELSSFAQGYVEAMFFTNADTGDDKRENHANELGVERLTKSAVADIASDCAGFLSSAMPDGKTAQEWLDRANEATGYDDSQAGRDFWFTRQGHGVGYWDRTADVLPPDIGEGLTALSKRFGECYPEIYNGWIYYR